jgi:hypothetical protein
MDAMVDLWGSPRADHWGARWWGRPERVVAGFEGRCWGNARRAAAADPGLAYVEGVVQRAGYVYEPHGWCLDRASGGVVEVTGPRYAEAVGYHGVVLEPFAVEHFLDCGHRRADWGFSSALGVVHAEPPALLFILLDELGKGVRTPMATWASWRELWRPARPCCADSDQGVGHVARGMIGDATARFAARR